jgi:hypothetical protein
VNTELAENRHPKVHDNNVIAERETITRRHFNETIIKKPKTKNQKPKTKNQDLTW